ncbi:hypothetical protein [Haloarcula sp. CGMCC 1.6347]|uniref:hypothetical protein n=1 Tax=Haloarcula sp. CGMCC 1.6347 TaxID=3111455 RepID=UPI00300F3B38
MDNYPSNMDVKSEVFLFSVYDRGGEASTTEIYEDTGISKNSRDYRFEKLKDMGLITVGKAKSGYGARDAPKVARLTDSGVRYADENTISSDASDMYFDARENEVLENTIERVEALENKHRGLKFRIENLENWKDKFTDLFSV